MAQTQLYSMQSSAILLGCLLNQPKLLLNGKTNLIGEDFEPCKFHRIIYWSIRMLLNQGVESIDEVVFDTFIQGYEEYAKICKDNNYLEVITNLKKISDPDTIDYHYNVVRKFTLLRYYKSNGCDVSTFFDEDNKWDKEMGQLDKVNIDDIIDYYESINVKAKKEFLINCDDETTKAGEGFEEIKNQFKKAPMFGATTFSPYLNTATRGLIKGQLTIYSMPSGTGKSTLGISNLVNICCEEIYDSDVKKYIKNQSYRNATGLYLQYEMDNMYEVTPKFVASISKVPTGHILNGEYENDEEERVDKAIEILNDSGIYIVSMPNFTLAGIETTVQEHVLLHHIEYFCMDYISEQASVNSEVAKNNGVTTRSDMTLAAMASKLKDIANKYNIAVLTFTQTNANVEVQEIINAGCIAGSRAVQNKADVAGVMMPLRKKEYELSKTYLAGIEKKGFYDRPKPNRIIHLYKLRFSSEEQGIKLWMNVNLGTGEVKDCWVTDKNNRPYKMKGTIL